MSRRAKPTSGRGAAAGRGAAGKDAGAKRGEPGLSVATHPRAGAQVRRSRAAAGLLGFILAGWLSLRAGVPFPVAGLRALGAGVAAYLLAWAASVAIWRHLIVAELRALAEQLATANEIGPPRRPPE